MDGTFIVLTTLVSRDGDQYAAICQELDVASCGDTVEEACANLDDAITLYLNGIETNGTRDRVFKEKGIVLEDTWPDAWTVPYGTFDFDVILRARVHSLPAVQV